MIELLLLQWVLFVLLMALGQFSPGPDMILLTRVALSDGMKAGCATAGGIATGLMLHAGVAIFLVDRMSLNTEAGWFTGLMIVAMLYLLWLSHQMLVSAFIAYYSGTKWEFDKNLNRSSLSPIQHYTQGLLCNMLNPKVALFLAGMVLPFQQLAAGSLTWLVVLWATIVVEGFILWCVWVRVLQRDLVRTWYQKHYQWIDAAFGVALLLIVVLLGSELVEMVNR